MSSSLTALTAISPGFIGVKDDVSGGSVNWSYKTCKAPVYLTSPPTNQHPTFLQAGCPSCRPTNSVKSTAGNVWEQWRRSQVKSGG